MAAFAPGVDLVRVVTLQRSPERRAAFSRRNAHLPHAFVEAVDGQHLTPQDIERSGLFDPALARTYTPGAYGCAYTHWQLWRQVAALGLPMTIAEDDAVFRHDFTSAAQRLLADLPADWDIVLWGWNLDSILSVHALPGVSPVVMVFDQDRLRASLDAFQALREPVHPLRLDKCFGMPAYSISPSGAQRLLASCFPLRAMHVWFPLLGRHLPNTGIDIAANAAYSTVRSFVSFPPLVATPNDHAVSTVQVRPTA